MELKTEVETEVKTETQTSIEVDSCQWIGWSVGRLTGWLDLD